MNFTGSHLAAAALLIATAPPLAAQTPAAPNTPARDAAPAPGPMVETAKKMAQAPASAPITRFSGKVQSISGNKITVLTEQGQVGEAIIPPDVPFNTDVPATRADLAAAKMANCFGTGRSREQLQINRCVIIRPETKLVNKGFFETGGNNVRLTGDVVSVKSGPAGALELEIAYKDGQQRISVPTTAKVGKSRKSSLAELQVGDKLTAAAQVVDGQRVLIAVSVQKK